jgi:hypothetical protein
MQNSNGQHHSQDLIDNNPHALDQIVWGLIHPTHIHTYWSSVTSRRTAASRFRL